MITTCVVAAIAISVLVFILRRQAMKVSELKATIQRIDKAIADGSVEEARHIRLNAESMRHRLASFRNDTCSVQMAETQQAIKSVNALAKECNKRIQQYE